MREREGGRWEREGERGGDERGKEREGSDGEMGVIWNRRDVKRGKETGGEL